MAPRLSDVSFDSSYFDRVEESLRGKLVAAWKAYRARKGKQVALAVREIGLDNRYALLIRGLQTLTVAHPAATKAGIDMLERSAAAGEPRAMAVLGVLKVSGFPGFPRDTNGGRKLLEQASAAGDAAAARVLGMGYVTGWMGRVDPPLAEQYLRLSSDRGDARGTFQLASMYFTGHGVAKDDFEAERLYIKAAKAGYVEAQAMLGVRRLLHYGAGLTDDPSEALALLEKAAAKGQPNAMYYLGMFYVRYGKRIGRLDIKRGVDLFRRCAEATLNTECAFAYATALDKGLSVPRDPVRAYALYVLISSRPQPGKAPARRDELAKSMSYEDLARANVIAVQLAQNASKAHRKKTVK